MLARSGKLAIGFRLWGLGVGHAERKIAEMAADLLATTLLGHAQELSALEIGTKHHDGVSCIGCTHVPCAPST